MMHELMERKITSDLRKAPETKLLREQRARYSASDPVTDWWVMCVTTGTLNVMDVDWDGDFSRKGAVWPHTTNKEDLWVEFSNWAEKTNSRRLSFIPFMKEMRQLGVANVKRRGKNYARIPDVKAAKEFLAHNGVCFADEDEYEGEDEQS